jgi:hypothetical protein
MHASAIPLFLRGHLIAVGEHLVSSPLVGRTAWQGNGYQQSGRYDFHHDLCGGLASDDLPAALRRLGSRALPLFCRQTSERRLSDQRLCLLICRWLSCGAGRLCRLRLIGPWPWHPSSDPRPEICRHCPIQRMTRPTCCIGHNSYHGRYRSVRFVRTSATSPSADRWRIAIVFGYEWRRKVLGP